MATFPVPFNQTNPIASIGFDNYHAPAVAVGDLIGGNQSCLAKREYNSRKRLLEEEDHAVTTAELKDSRLRLHALQTTEAQVFYNVGNGGMQTMASNIANLTTLMHAMAANIANLTTTMTITQAKIDNIEAKIDITQAKIENARSRRKNKEGYWLPILVDRVGASPIGVVPQNHPATLEAALRLTHDNIDQLQVSFNLPLGHFGTPNENDIGSRRKMVLSYLTDE